MKHSSKIIIVLLISCVNNLDSFSQIVKIISYSNGSPIEDVAVFNQDRKISALSDEKGMADITNFKLTDSVYFQHPSYELLVMAKGLLLQKKTVYLRHRNIIMDEFVISASKSVEKKKDVPYKIDLLEGMTLHELTTQTSADLLLNTGNVCVQKSQGGGGSPILRGFEANKILLVVDGVRMNNAIYRSGHLQNSITIDNNILNRAEVIYGPSSVIYGSDALGGVIHYYTRDPELADGEKKVNVKADFLAQHSTVNAGEVANATINMGFKEIAFLSSVSYSSYDDLKMGANRNPFLGNFGKVEHFVGTVNNMDSTIKNQSPLTQKKTGYNQYDLLQKVLFRPNNDLDIIINLQYSTSSDVDRFDKLNDYSGNNLKYAEYYYGPQERLLAAMKTHFKQTTQFFTSFTTTVAYQKIDEDRISRKFRVDDKLFQLEDLDVYSFNVDFFKFSNPRRKINYGIEAIYNNLVSQAYYENIYTSERSDAETSRYPDGKNNTSSYSIYGAYRVLINSHYIFSMGARYNNSYLYSTFTGNFLELPFEEVKIGNGAITGSLSLVYRPNDLWQFNIIGSTGYRNPNIDDYGKVRAKDGEVTIPNNNLSPEYTYNCELGISKTFDGYIRLEGNVFVSYITDAIVRTLGSYSGEDSLEFDGDMYRIVTNANAEEALIKGVSLNLISDLNSNLSFKSTLNYTQGENLTTNEPLGHIPPLFGRTSIRYKAKKVDNEIFLYYNGWKHIEDFSPFGEDNDAEATEHGYPGWYTLNARISYRLNPTIRLQFAIENIFDAYYKPYASGISAPGRNFIFSMRASI